MWLGLTLFVVRPMATLILLKVNLPFLANKFRIFRSVLSRSALIKDPRYNRIGTCRILSDLAMLITGMRIAFRL
jgi:hypothetical protein